MEAEIPDNTKLLSASFYGSLQSCDAEIARENFQCPGDDDDDETSSASRVKTSFVAALFSIALVFFSL